MLANVLYAAAKQDLVRALAAPSCFATSLSTVVSSILRSSGEASTSRGDACAAFQASCTRQYAKAAASKKAPAKAPPSPPPASTAPKVQNPDPRYWLEKVRNPRIDPMSLLTEEQRAVVDELATPPPKPEPSKISPKGEAAPPSPPGLKQRDVVSLVHQSLSNLAGHNVHFRPFFFSNIFQSAPVVASYVASALEAGYAWPRIERFFMSSVEADKSVKAIKVQISGRQGQKADMASLKTWEYGPLALNNHSEAVDYGTATALTRLSLIGVKVWIRYHDDAIPDNYFNRKTGFSMPLPKVLSAPLPQLPYRSPSAWWSQPATAQPLQNRTWQAFQPDSGYDPTRTPLRDFLKAQRPLMFKNASSRMRYMRQPGRLIRWRYSRRRRYQLGMQAAARYAGSSSSSSSSSDEEGSSSSSSSDEEGPKAVPKRS